MRLGIDAREIQGGVYTGIGRPLVNFLQYFATQHHEDSCVLFSSKKIPFDFGASVTNVIIPEGITFIWDQWHLPQAIKKAGVDIFYSPYYKIPLLKSCKTVSAILDLMYIAYEPYYKIMSLLAKLYYATFGRLYAQRADKILTCSQYSKKDIQRIYGVQTDKIEVIPLTLAPFYFSPKDEGKIFEIKKRFKINGRYIFYMGNFKAHKNIAHLIHAFAGIAAEWNDVNLVLAGPREHTYLELVNIIQGYNLINRVIFTGTIMESDEPQYLYQGAEIFVMPTFYEGFGLPPLEAMACAVPVVASKTTSIPEIIGDAGILVDPHNVAEITNAIKKILQDQELKQELIRKGLIRVEVFKSQEIAKMTYDFFKTVEGSY